MPNAFILESLHVLACSDRKINLLRAVVASILLILCNLLTVTQPAIEQTIEQKQKLTRSASTSKIVDKRAEGE